MVGPSPPYPPPPKSDTELEKKLNTVCFFQMRLQIAIGCFNFLYNMKYNKYGLGSMTYFSEASYKETFRPSNHGLFIFTYKTL